MRTKQIEVPSKRKYSRISFKKRELLVKAICSEGQNLAQVSKKLKINPSTARMILRKYNQTGEFRTKNFKNKRNTDLMTIISMPNQKKGQQNSLPSKILEVVSEILEYRSRLYFNKQSHHICL